MFYDFTIFTSQYANKAYLFNIYISMCLCLSMYTHTLTLQTYKYHPRESSTHLNNSHKTSILASLKAMIECSLSYYSDPMFFCAKCASPSSEFKPNLILSFHCTQHDPHFSLHCPRQGHGPV